MSTIRLKVSLTPPPSTTVEMTCHPLLKVKNNIRLDPSSYPISTSFDTSVFT